MVPLFSFARTAISRLVMIRMIPNRLVEVFRGSSQLRRDFDGRDGGDAAGGCFDVCHFVVVFVRGKEWEIFRPMSANPRFRGRLRCSAEIALGPRESLLSFGGRFREPCA